MREAALDALEARPGFPGALFNLALAQSLGGDGAAALVTLNALADLHIDFLADDMPEFAALAQQPGWRPTSNACRSCASPWAWPTPSWS